MKSKHSLFRRALAFLHIQPLPEEPVAAVVDPLKATHPSRRRTDFNFQESAPINKPPASSSRTTALSEEPAPRVAALRTVHPGRRQSDPNFPANASITRSRAPLSSMPRPHPERNRRSTDDDAFTPLAVPVVVSVFDNDNNATPGETDDDQRRFRSSGGGDFGGGGATRSWDAPVASSEPSACRIEPREPEPYAASSPPDCSPPADPPASPSD